MAESKGVAPSDGRGIGGPKAISPEESVAGEVRQSGVPSETKSSGVGPMTGPNPGRAPRS